MKDYIKNNRPLFDDQEPAAGHAERFEALLDKAEVGIEEKKVKRFPLFAALSAVASVIIIVMVMYFYNNGNQDALDSQGDQMQLTEFEETNMYYEQQMKAQIADIMCKLPHTDTQNQAQLSSDLQNLMASNEQFLNEIAQNENQEMAIYYLKKHYQTNIQVLENINEKLGKHTKC